MQQADTFAPYIARAKSYWSRFVVWISRDEHKQKAIEIRDQVEKAFTEHPHETGETYLEHLWFTIKMTGRMLYSAIVLLIHGIFPFLVVRTASGQIEKIYLIMKSRIPVNRRNVIDTDWSL